MAQSMRCGPCRSEPPSIVFESDQRKGREIPLRLIQNGESSRRGQASTRRSSPSTPSPRDSRASAGPSERRVPLFGRSLERDSRALNARFVFLFPSFFVEFPNVHFPIHVWNIHSLRGGFLELHNVDAEVKAQLLKLASISLCANARFPAKRSDFFFFQRRKKRREKPPPKKTTTDALSLRTFF